MLRFLRAAPAALAVVGAASLAEASAIVPKADGDVHASELRIAFSTSVARSVAWEQLVLDEARGELAWLVAVPKGGWVEAGDAHFLESLDEATAPVIAPSKSLGCPPLARELTFGPRAVWARPIDKGFPPMSGAAAAGKLVELGFVVDAGTRTLLQEVDRIDEQVALLLLGPGPRGVTQVVRVLGPSGRRFPLALVPARGAPAALRTWTFASGRVRFAEAPALDVEFDKLVWSSSGSSYPSLLDEMRKKAHPGVAVPFSGIDGLFVDQPGGGASSVVPSLVRRYFGAVEGGSSSSASCAARASSFFASEKTVAATCPKPVPWSTATPPSCTPPSTGEIAPSELSCGPLDDVAAAMSGLAPAKTWLTRFEGSALYALRTLQTVAPVSLPSYQEAKNGTCTPSTVDAGSTPPSGTWSPPAGTTPASGSSPGGSSDGSRAGEACAGAFAEGCAGSSSSSNDEGGCGSSSSGGGGGGCSGDSGGSSDDGCGGGSSGSSGGCGGSSGSSGSCSGASNSADDGCRVAKSKLRVRFSALAYALVAAATFARRARRRR